jgi:hypothetical protein
MVSRSLASKRMSSRRRIHHDRLGQGRALVYRKSPAYEHATKLPRHRRMRPVLQLNPASRPAGAMASVASFRDQALEAHVAGRAVWPDPAGLEWRDEDAVGATAQWPRQIALAHGERQRPQVIEPRKTENVPRRSRPPAALNTPPDRPRHGPACSRTEFLRNSSASRSRSIRTTFAPSAARRCAGDDYDLDFEAILHACEGECAILAAGVRVDGGFSGCRGSGSPSAKAWKQRCRACSGPA